MTANRGLRVLAITADRRFLREVRLALPLSALGRAGLIAGFRIFCPLDGGLSDHFPLEAFDAVVVQRLVPAWVTDFLRERAIPFLLDVDDLLLARPAYSQGLPSRPGRRRLGEAVLACAALSVSTPRLLASLEQRLDASLGEKAVIIPNALPEGMASEKPATRPEGVLWTSSDRPALLGSAGPILAAVAAFAAARNMPVWLTGHLDQETARVLPMARSLGTMDYWQHKLFLREHPTALALAPLETHGDAETLEFINCKSDVKLAEYGGLGHAGVYSLAPPYAESDLHAGRLAPNTGEAWADALEFLYAEGYRQCPEQARAVQAARNAPKIARECWLPALEHVRLARPLRLADLLKAMGRGGAVREDGGALDEPLHHRFADRLYHDVYCRWTPRGWRRRLGGWLEGFVRGGD